MHDDAALSGHLQGTDGRCTAVETHRGSADRPSGSAGLPGRGDGAAGRLGAVRGVLTTARRS